MINWLVEINKILGEMRAKAKDGLHYAKNKEMEMAASAQRYLRDDLGRLRDLWENAGFDYREFNDLTRHIKFGEQNDYEKILWDDLEQVSALAGKHAIEKSRHLVPEGFQTLLHPIVREVGLDLYQRGYYREAVVNSIMAIADLIRERTGLHQDGVALVTEALSVERPKLVLSEIETESGKNDQKGFMLIMQGLYIGVRNPKAHSLQHDLNESKAAEYLILASLIMRRVADAEAREN